MIGGEKLLTTYFLNCIAQEIFGHPETSKIPYDYYIALSSTEPKLDGSGVTEPSMDTGYQRVRIDNSHLFFGEINNDRVLNHDKAYFPESIKPWYDISYYAIFDMPTDGNLLMFGKLNSTMNVPIKTIVSIPIETLGISVNNSVGGDINEY